MKKLYDYKNTLKLTPKSIDDVVIDFKERILIAA
jgi:hypothetical protein